MKINVTKRVHPIWLEFEAINRINPEMPLPPSILGKYQYIYESEKGSISLVELPNYFMDSITLWEIYSLEGNLFEDIERFNSKEEAEERINELL
jgi:hypothetical protein